VTKRQITEQVTFVGVVDWDRRLFDELIETPFGTSYNSYLITGSEKNALIDTVDPTKTEDFLAHLRETGVTRIDYIVSNHAEQDHSGSLQAVLDVYPMAKVVCNAMCKTMLIDEHGIAEEKFFIIEDGHELSLGNKTLRFIFTPWVHWPETMCTYLVEDAILFTCDFFGAHLATSDLFVTNHEEIIPHMKRYYAEIMMPFAGIIAKNIEKLRPLSLKLICPSHGPLHKDPQFPIDTYAQWVSPLVKAKVVIVYTSNHGSTKKLVEYASEQLAAHHLEVHQFNMTVSSLAAIAMEMVDASMLLIASPTFLGGFHPNVGQAIYILNALRPKTKLIGYLGSNQWGGHVIEDLHAGTKGFSKAKIMEPLLIKGSPSKPDFAQVDAFVEKILLEHDLLEDVLLNQLPARTPLVSPPRSITLVIGGAAGQGLKSLQAVLTELLKEEGFYIFSTKEYESRIRGGSSTVEIRVSDRPVIGYMDHIDLFLPLDKPAVAHVKDRMSEQTLILGDREQIGDHPQIKHIPFIEMAKNIGNKVYANTIAVGVILGLFEADKHHAFTMLQKKFAHKGDEVVKRNIEALNQGYALGLENQDEIAQKCTLDITRDASVKNTFFLTGAQSIAWGAIAGGCNFISAYPMSPSTGVLTELANQKQAFGIVVEQVEDEISAMNMTVGAWYAGARALANTSGGGFALMGEAVSLAGMVETPMVCHVAQRPGPASGLPTRTAQEDLNLVLYSGHGEFARAIYAPSTVEEGFELTRQAFLVADKYQVPTFILTDQYFMDTFVNIQTPELPDVAPKQQIVKTNPDYQRYKHTENGISPRGVPGYGEGVVCADSDEHDESGHVTESMSVRNEMVHKRMQRFDLLQEAIIPPKRYGNATAPTLIIGWGTTFGSIIEALETVDRHDLGYMHFTQVFPLPDHIDDWLSLAKQIIVVENNATGQFAQLLRQHTNVPVDSLLRYDGLPFTVEELVEAFDEVVSP
jgi:2-oxoglutarate ferredoxin oxidoreductase subunit alpha